VLALEAERSGHAAAARIELLDFGARDLPQQLHRGAGAGDGFLVAVAMEHDAPSAQLRCRVQAHIAVADGLDQELGDVHGLLGHRLHPTVVGQQVRILVAQSEQAGRFAADDRYAACRVRGQPEHGVACHRARLLQ
jgi:hypothetical protein